jgi:hypothetical protein
MRSLYGLIIAGLFLASPALAQDPSGISSELERTASTTPEEKLAYASVSNQEIAEAEKAVARSLEAARKGGDAQVVECLLSRLTAIRALQSVSERAEGAMKEALAAGSEEKANHEFRKIAVAVSKTRQLRAEANRCTQTDDGGAGASTIVDWESFLQDYGDVFDQYDLDDLDFGQDPPQISPFQ